jgi:hypothetical protein
MADLFETRQFLVVVEFGRYPAGSLAVRCVSSAGSDGQRAGLLAGFRV